MKFGHSSIFMLSSIGQPVAAHVPSEISGSIGHCLRGHLGVLHAHALHVLLGSVTQEVAGLVGAQHQRGQHSKQVRGTPAKIT